MTHITNLGASTPLLEGGKSLRIPVKLTRYGGLPRTFGSAANFNVQLHCLVLEGVHRCDADGASSFIDSDAPTDDELHGLLQTLIGRLMKMLARTVMVEMRQEQAEMGCSHCR